MVLREEHYYLHFRRWYYEKNIIIFVLDDGYEKNIIIFILDDGTTRRTLLF